MSEPKNYSDLMLFRRLLFEARSYWFYIAGTFLLSLLATPVALLTPLPLKIAVDSVVGSRQVPGFVRALLPSALTSSKSSLLILAAVLAVAVVLASQLQTLATSVLQTFTGERLVLGFRAQLFRHVQRLSFTFHDARGTADSIYRIQYDAPSIQYIAVQGVIPFLSAGFTLASMLYVTMRINWRLSLVAMVISPALWLLFYGYKTRMSDRYRDVKRLESSALGVIQEVLNAMRVVQAFGREDTEHQRFVRRSSESMHARIRIAIAEASYGALVNLVTAIGTALVLYIGVRSVQSGSITLGDLLVVITYLAQLYEPLKTISKQVAGLQSSLAGARRAFELLDEVPDVVEHPHARHLDRAHGDIEFRGVTFGYSTDVTVLQDVSLSIPAGSRVGIAGHTGAGKTTLVALMTRFYDPQSGQVLLDGVDLQGYRIADLRNQFAIVLQESVLFSTTVAENIAYARPNASQQEIVAAADAANAHEFIQQLPQGYDTLVGERGMRLSGGERQRIALARAFLKDAPILILDEPTSSVDVQTEASIMEAMERLMHGRTTLMIAHRLSTLAYCDFTVELERGRLVDAESRRFVLQSETQPLRGVAVGTEGA